MEEEFLRCCPPEFTRKYELVRPLGQGTTSLVYLARQIEFDRDVVVKIFHHEEPELHQRFMREGEMLSRMNHPAIMQLLDFGEHGEFLYLVAKYVPGTNLKDLVATQRFEWPRLVELFRAISDGLAAVHAKGILHRDLKPANILIGEDGAPIILDFGFARATDTRDLTRTGFYIGTPSYGAPEALLENRYDARTDLYAIGVMMYELLIGRNPFYDTNLRNVISHHVDLAFEDLPPLPPDLPGSLTDLLSRLLAKDPARRPSSAREVHLILKRLSNRKAGVAEVPPPEPPAAKADSGVNPWMLALALSGVISAGLLAYETNDMIPETGLMSLDSATGASASPGSRVSDTEREALMNILRDVSTRAQSRQELRQQVATAPFEAGPLEIQGREHVEKAQQDLEILREIDEDLRARIPVESLGADDRRVVAWVRTLRFITAVDRNDFARALERPVLGSSGGTPAALKGLGMDELKLLAGALDSMLEVLDPAAFSERSFPWILSYVSICFTVARCATGGSWETSLISLRDSRVEAFEKKLDASSWKRGPGSALARLCWLSWRRGRGFVSAEDEAVQRSMALEAIAELKRHPGCDTALLTSLEVFLAFN